MNCPNCGAPVEAGKKVCEYCGATITHQAQTRSQPQQSPKVPTQRFSYPSFPQPYFPMPMFVDPEAERNKMTQSLRYNIMRRDGFKCQLCGATVADGARLEVDHIIPVSKGGLTEPSNLRTLCSECNRGKRDKFDPDGDN